MALPGVQVGARARPRPREAQHGGPVSWPGLVLVAYLALPLSVLIGVRPIATGCVDSVASAFGG